LREKIILFFVINFFRILLTRLLISVVMILCGWKLIYLNLFIIDLLSLFSLFSISRLISDRTAAKNFISFFTNGSIFIFSILNLFFFLLILFFLHLFWAFDISLSLYLFYLHIIWIIDIMDLIDDLGGVWVRFILSILKFR